MTFMVKLCCIKNLSGALLVRNESAHTLQKAYFGGGTVDVSISREDFHVPRKNLTDR